jgi:hypothetical protein
MIRRLVVVCSVVFVAAAMFAVALTGWLVYQPVKADLLVYSYVQMAAVRDPAHAPLYHHVYDTFRQYTRANSLHYLVHKAAGAVAAATGHAHAAQVQASRARYHLPSHQGALHDLLMEISNGLRRVVRHFT